MEFHERLKLLRKENNMTQSALAKELAYGSTAISNYESGHNQPSIADLKKIAAIFSVSMDYLLGVTDIRHPYAPEDDSQQFYEFSEYFAILTKSSKDELLLYMQWLINRQNTKINPYAEPTDFKSSSLKVAQKPVEFKLPVK